MTNYVVCGQKDHIDRFHSASPDDRPFICFADALVDQLVQMRNFNPSPSENSPYTYDFSPPSTASPLDLPSSLFIRARTGFDGSTGARMERDQAGSTPSPGGANQNKSPSEVTHLSTEIENVMTTWF
ncbi:hypothetical protein F2P81_016883 [Scophthalmus maximus]|uniref:Uncharacterized protein n=1 Tax=Scophthalmus maximus TaxID=52904 RepID=A0A6A4SIH3_SCOMX|nr:hypothetical protein F2P81_016883 [Scophthalmus maximus]